MRGKLYSGELVHLLAERDKSFDYGQQLVTDDVGWCM